MAAQHAIAEVGTSGFSYGHWADVFYPPTIRTSSWLGFYAERFSTVEINSTFCGLPSESTVAAWDRATGDDFTFSMKAIQLITHVRRLENVAGQIATLLGRVRVLGPKLGPVLYQLPPDLERDDGLLLRFLEVLPTDVDHVVEFRHPSWYAKDVYEMLGGFRASLCVHDMPGSESDPIATTDLAYVRLHGPTGDYCGRYGPARIERWADVIEDIDAKRTLVYFNNDVGGNAVCDALEMTRLLGQRVKEVG